MASIFHSHVGGAETPLTFDWSKSPVFCTTLIHMLIVRVVYYINYDSDDTVFLFARLNGIIG